MENSIRKLTIYTFLFLAFNLFFVEKAFAVCPVCTIAVGAGVGLSRWLGIDDTISGLWIGGLIVSMIIWTMGFFDKKKINFKGRNIIIIAIYYLTVIIPLYFTGIIGHPANSLLCICGFDLDKLLLGIIAGSLGFWLGASSYSYLKKRNKGHAYFAFQKVIMPILPLIILSMLFYYLTK